MARFARFVAIAAVVFIGNLTAAAASADAPQNEIDLLNQLMFPSTPRASEQRILRLSKQTSVSLALPFSNPTERTVIAEQT